MGTLLRHLLPSARPALTFMLKCTNTLPMHPPSTPSNKNHAYSSIAGGSSYDVWKSVSLPDPVGFITSRDNAATTAAKNALIIVLLGNIVLTSSKEKSTPPRGAPNATETPAAAAVLINSRCLVSFFTYLLENLDKQFAQQHATCTRGPSFPKLSPAEHDKHKPNIFTTRVFASKTRAMTKPPKIVFTSGMPLPRASGAKSLTIIADIVARATVTKMKATMPPLSATDAQSTQTPWQDSRDM
mmetsp:Transcript_38793/g.61298  ORF Transcript_38793/g.61298 Transcript_38793/m.61298 type:complete len:242 (-) Transcript_38793:578-1303(-)